LEETPKTVSKKKSTPTLQQAQPVSGKRRRKWTEDETTTLLLGVKKHGIGNWTKILNDPGYGFEDRTTLQLKDRFRTCFPHGLEEALVEKQQVLRNDNLPVEGQSRPVASTALQEGVKSTRKHPRAPGCGASMWLDTSTNKPQPVNSSPSYPQAAPSRARKRHFKKLDDLGIQQPLDKSARRSRRSYTDEEDQNILKGYKKYGPSAWAHIRDDPELGLSGRTSGDLRDRFRTRFPNTYTGNIKDKHAREKGKASVASSRQAQALAVMQPAEPIETQAQAKEAPSEPTSSQDKLPSMYLIMDDPGYNLPSISYTDLLNYVPVSDTQSFDLLPALDWGEPTTDNGDLSRILLDESWGDGAVREGKGRHNVSDISNLCIEMAQGSSPSSKVGGMGTVALSDLLTKNVQPVQGMARMGRIQDIMD
jgi:hypothetical protein